MPLTQNLWVHNAHNTSTLAGHPPLCCLFKGCNHQFKLRSTLSRHQWTSHLPDAGVPPLLLMLHPSQVDLMNANFIAPLRGAFILLIIKVHLLSTCTHNTFLVLQQWLLQCLLSILIFKHLNTLILCQWLLHCLLTIPIPKHIRHLWGHIHHFSSQTTISLTDFHYDDDHFLPPGSDKSHQDGSHLPSNSPSPAHDNHTHLSSADGRESDSVM